MKRLLAWMNRLKSIISATSGANQTTIGSGPPERVVKLSSNGFEDSESISHQPCRLLALPAELRNEIWRLAIVRKWPDEIFLDEGLAKLHRSFRPFLCCRQVMDEAGIYFEQSRDTLLRESLLYVNIPTSKWSLRDLKRAYEYLATLKDEDIAKIKRLAIVSPKNSDGTSRDLPTCLFQNGFWKWWPAITGSYNTHQVLHVLKKDRKKLKRMIPQGVGIRYYFWFGLNWAHMKTDVVTFILTGRVADSLMAELVREAGSEQLSKANIKWILAYRWSTRKKPF